MMSKTRRPEPRAQSHKAKVPTERSAYVDALRMLARRELSEAQIRQRLARREHDNDRISSAIERLKEERAIDDERVAAAIARTETSVKKRGRLRVRRSIESAGIAADIARRAVEQAFEDLDGGDLLERSLARRLRGGRLIEDDREFQRLYRYLVMQGFESDQVLKLLSAKRTRKPRA